jgi:uncharacterized protein YkwD
MPVSKRRTVKLLFLFSIFMATIVTLSPLSAQQPPAPSAKYAYKQYLPFTAGSAQSAAEIGEYDLINQLRARAGVPPVGYNPTLEENCLEHARYMAENGILTHEQNPEDPYFSRKGQVCARQANVWLASGTTWKTNDAIMDWMASVPHRAWLLYPTSKEFGYGFYRSEASQHAGAALDILSGADFTADEAYAGWPVRYPGSGQKGVPATRYPITLNWRYFGPEPVLNRVLLTRADGSRIGYDATTQLSYGHKGIKITPNKAWPAESKIKVVVEGNYEGTPFSYAWHFRTGSKPLAVRATEAAGGN